MDRATIPIRHVIDILSVVQGPGIDPAVILARSDISPPLLDSLLSRVTQAQLPALIRITVRTTGDEFWGVARDRWPSAHSRTRAGRPQLSERSARPCAPASSSTACAPPT